MPRAYPDCDRCGDTGLDPENTNEPCHDCQPAPTADQTALESLSDTLYDALYAITPFAEQHFADER
ncbi:hypothetical protein [Streptomyces sp. NPDC055733]